MRRLMVVAVLAASFGAIGSPPANAALRSKYFQMPSGNIACAFFRPNLRCDILSGLNPEPEGDCEVDWTGLSLKSNGRAGPVCAGDTVYNPDAPVLAYGEKWKRGGIVCRSRESGLRCRNAIPHGFVLSRDSWRTF